MRPRWLPLILAWEEDNDSIKRKVLLPREAIYLKTSGPMRMKVLYAANISIEMLNVEDPTVLPGDI